MSCDGVRHLPLTDVLEFIVDNRGKTAPTAETGIPLIATNCIRNTELYPVFEKVRYVSQDIYQNWFRSHPQPGDIIFVNKGTPGRVCLVPDPVSFVIAQDMMALRVNEDIIDGNYLFAVLRSPQFQHQIEQLHVGTLIPHVKKGDLDKLLIPLPSREIQEAIGATYFSLSYKIELNNRINKILEEMAQALFKSWFVDFEPFQDGEFEDSELGPIPKGWRVGSLDEIADFLNGLAMQKFRCEGDNYLPVIKIKELNQGFTDSNSDRARTDIPDRYIIRDGDVVFSWSGTLLAKLWTGGVGGLNQHLFKVTSDSFPKWFYYQWVLYHLEEFRSIAKDKATTMGHIKRSHLSNARVIIPDEESLAMLSETMEPIMNQIVDNSLQSNALIALRDTLLPKLMSGDVRVPLNEAEAEVAASS